MDESAKKSEAVDALLENKAGGMGSNTHADRLAGAFGKKENVRLPDFEKIRLGVLARRDAIEAERRRFRRVWVPGAAAAIALLAVGVFLIRNSEPKSAAATIAMEVTPGKPQNLRVENSLGLYVRSATGMTRVQNGTSLVLKAQAMSSLFDFEPNERLRAVRIETPAAVFSVIGTRFIISADKDRSFLAVESGAVRVEAAGKEYIIRGGEFWSGEKQVVQTGKTGEKGAKLFGAFMTPQDVTAITNTIIAKKDEATPAKRAERRVTVTLKSGSVVSGVLVSETADAVEVRAAAAGNQVLRFKKEEIADLR